MGPLSDFLQILAEEFSRISWKCSEPGLKILIQVNCIEQNPGKAVFQI